MQNPPPQTIEELTNRVDQLAGLTLAEVADALSVNLPINAKAEKGWIGQTIELFLGADAGNLAEPDFRLLDIELKTIPITSSGKALETTFVSVAPMKNQESVHWHQSSVYKKLKAVLWVPVICKHNAQDKPIDFADRQLGSGFIWRLPTELEGILQEDWEELMEKITFGEHDSINAYQGTYLQLRPKAANSYVRTQGFDRQGNPSLVAPKGFYLRTQFTQEILNQQFNL